MYIKRREREKENGKREAESKETEREGKREGGRERDGGGGERGVLCKSGLYLFVCVYVADVSQMYVSRAGCGMHFQRKTFTKVSLHKEIKLLEAYNCLGSHSKY